MLAATGNLQRTLELPSYQAIVYRVLGLKLNKHHVAWPVGARCGDSM